MLLDIYRIDSGLQSFIFFFYLSLMMALSERYANAWHMLIERQYLIL